MVHSIQEIERKARKELRALLAASVPCGTQLPQDGKNEIMVIDDGSSLSAGVIALLTSILPEEKTLRIIANAAADASPCAIRTTSIDADAHLLLTACLGLHTDRASQDTQTSSLFDGRPRLFSTLTEDELAHWCSAAGFMLERTPPHPVLAHMNMHYPDTLFGLAATARALAKAAGKAKETKEQST